MKIQKSVFHAYGQYKCTPFSQTRGRRTYGQRLTVSKLSVFSSKTPFRKLSLIYFYKYHSQTIWREILSGQQQAIVNVKKSLFDGIRDLQSESGLFCIVCTLTKKIMKNNYWSRQQHRPVNLSFGSK